LLACDLLPIARDVAPCVGGCLKDIWFIHKSGLDLEVGEGYFEIHQVKTLLLANGWSRHRLIKLLSVVTLSKGSSRCGYCPLVGF
jgi:hypothetical protein